MKSKSYEDFVEKFKPKKTTDDCYTPPLVYETVKEWACEKYGISSKAAAEKTSAHNWILSDREKEIVESLGQ